jgi:Uma2 family endonuclease
MATTITPRTIDDLERQGPPDGRWELINGELVEISPGSEDHGAYGLAVGSALLTFTAPRGLGRTFGADTGFVLADDPPTVHVPDAAFVRAERLPRDRDRRRFLRVLPDIAVEVISPSDRPGDFIAKVALWLNAGVPLVWLVDPEMETVTVFERGKAPLLLSADQTLTGGDILPGFELPVRSIFVV